MIKHHPTAEMLMQFSQGTLPESLSIAVSAHVEMCPCCAKQVAKNEALCGQELFSDSDALDLDFDFSQMISNITEDKAVELVKQYEHELIEYHGSKAVVPRAIATLPRSGFSHVGKLARARLDLGDGDVRASLLQISPGGEIPNHTHTGFELTLLLEGSFEDESGSYVAGDFIWLDGRHTHTPKTQDGCLCFTLVNSALHFNKGLSKLLNPIGNLIY
ncbi:ChrR family anti-sigma-E factor [Pseudoalteromonas aurantia]|uniref:Transcriptional regulator n=1 Tax=Pseudoalteromonas aurantia TaxID=43654 RepID=A0A5S3V8M2_9GAMM|nr:ChrR family anti-sigma-E factor [Pseudoalteromonas aurantia]TMO68230.1 transcriptional regulator [Pseudoalteromonas aurantia]TMO72559.1 transcriptional regulator [Pseudoalteromonas aurantia]